MNMPILGAVESIVSPMVSKTELGGIIITPKNKKKLERGGLILLPESVLVAVCPH